MDRPEPTPLRPATTLMQCIRSRIASAALCAALVGATALSAPAAAQTIRGRTAAAGAPVPGVVVLLIDSSGMTRRRTLSDPRGDFSLVAPGPGNYSVQTLRIGYRPGKTLLLALAAGQDTVLSIALERVPVILDRVVVRERRKCGALTDAAGAVTVWNAVRAALESQSLTAAARSYTMRAITTNAQFAGDGRTRQPEVRRAHQGPTVQAFASLPADSLSRVGYVSYAGGPVPWSSPARSAPEGQIEYRGPDGPVLLSDRFAQDHCFDLVASSDPEQRLVGLEFRPSSRRPPHLIDVRGTMWVERSTSELRRIEFAYEGLPNDVGADAGGSIEYVQLPTGGWIVRRWEIRMPVLRVAVNSVPDGSMGRVRNEAKLVRDGLQVARGEVVDVSQDGRTVWTARQSFIAGVVQVPSATGASSSAFRVQLRLLGARPGAAESDRPDRGIPLPVDERGGFRIDSLLPGSHRITVSNLDADSLALASDTVTVTASAPPDSVVVRVRVPSVHDVLRRLCGKDARDTASRAIIGTVRNESGQLVSGATVTAIFIGRVEIAAGDRLVGRSERRSVRTDTSGRFLVCDVSSRRPIQLMARAEGAVSDPVTVRVAASRAYGIAGVAVRK